MVGEGQFKSIAGGRNTKTEQAQIYRAENGEAIATYKFSNRWLIKVEWRRWPRTSNKLQGNSSSGVAEEPKTACFWWKHPAEKPTNSGR